MFSQYLRPAANLMHYRVGTWVTGTLVGIQRVEWQDLLGISHFSTDPAKMMPPKILCNLRVPPALRRSFGGWKHLGITLHCVLHREKAD